MITVKDLKSEVVKRLDEVQGYTFKVFEDLGLFQESVRNGNNLTETVNCMFSIPESEVVPLSNNVYALAYSANLDFLFPIDDRADYTGDYPNVQTFRTALSLALQNALKVDIEAEDGKTYTGGTVYNLPIAGERVYNPIIGDCIAYSATIAFAFMENAVNSTDFSIEIDGERISFTNMKISRNPTLSADILKDSENGQSSAYAESATFKIDLTLPALSNSAFALKCMQYLLGLMNANEKFTVKITAPSINGQISEKEMVMVIGGLETTASGVSNLAYICALVSYTTPEEVGG